jgi:murein L,D-transpeptidase YcbB/YkuD
MVTRGSCAGASAKAFLVVFGFSFMASASAAPRASLLVALATPPAVVEQLAFERLREAPSSGPISGDSALSPLLPYIAAPYVAAPRVAVAPPATDFDIAAELVTEEQRGFAQALDRWIAQSQGAVRRARRKAIARAYASLGYRPLWRGAAQWRASAVSALERLQRAAEDGLDLRGYVLPGLAAEPSVADDLALSEAVVAYADQAAGARVDPQRVSRLIGARLVLPEPSAVLAATAAAGAGAGDALRSHNPDHAGYRALRAKLAELRSARLPEARRYAESRAVTSDANDRQAAPAAPRKRADARLEAEIIANMERWRWLPRELGDDRIEVNIPDFELAVIRDGAVTHRARVIVGKEGTPTPVFSDAMQFIIVNPYWNVPPSILAKEMLPKHGGSLQSIAASGYEVIYQNGQARVRQRPGEGNALGRIKFMFPNDFSVYLHDTPSRGLFSAAHRAFSHGCVRVEEPFRLAEAVLGPNSGWREERVRKLIGGSERYINLARPLPIHIEYFTAYVDARGRLQLRGDLYGYSAKVRAALGLDG